MQEEKELSREEYGRLLKAAKDLHRLRLLLIMETICATGIRVSEIKYITLEAARAGRADIYLRKRARQMMTAKNKAKENKR